MNTRRLRRLFGVTLLGSTAWAVLGCLVGLVFQYNLIPNLNIWLQTPVPGGLPVAGALAGAVVGAINGLLFQSFIAAGVGGVLGAIAGMGALWLARRAQQPRSTSLDVPRP